MNATATQGHKANRSGKRVEDLIAHMLHVQGLSYQRQAPIGHGIYNTPLHADFLVLDAPGYPHGLIVECKWQDVGGSVDEKFPYLVANIKECYPYPTIIVLCGSGYRKEAERWLRRQVSGRLVAVYSLEQMLSWLLRLNSERQR